MKVYNEVSNKLFIDANDNYCNGCKYLDISSGVTAKARCTFTKEPIPFEKGIVLSADIIYIGVNAWRALFNNLRDILCHMRYYIRVNKSSLCPLKIKTL